MRSVIFSQCRVRRMGVMGLDLGALTTARARETCTETSSSTNRQSIHRQQTFPPMPGCARCHVCTIWKHRDRLKAMWLPLLTTSSVANDHLNVHLCLMEYSFTMQTCHLHLKHDKTNGHTEFDNYDFVHCAVKMGIITGILTANVRMSL